MKKYIIVGVIALSTNIFASSANSITEIKNTKVLVIDLDKERKDGNKGGASDILKAVIHIGNNDEVQFIGKNTLRSRPITIIIKDKFGEIKDSFVNKFTIKASKLDVGDIVVIKKRRGKPLAEKRIVK